MKSLSVNDSLRKASIAINNAMVGGRSWRHEFIKAGEIPSMSLKNKVLRVPPFGYLNQEEDDLVRAHNYHENCHAAFTPVDPDDVPKMNDLLKNIVNSLEDHRIEHLGAQKLKGASYAFATGTVLQAKRIMDEWHKNETDKEGHTFQEKLQALPVTQALTHLSFEDDGRQLDWELSPQAKKYADAIREPYHSWREQPNVEDPDKGFWEIVELGRKIQKLLEEEKMKQKGQGDDDDDQEGSESQEGGGEGKSKSKKQKKSSKPRKEKSPDQALEDSVKEKEQQKKKGKGESGEDGESEEGEDSEGEDTEGDSGKGGKGKKGKSSKGESEGEGEDGESGEGEDDTESGKGEGKGGEGEDGEGDDDEEGEGETSSGGDSGSRREGEGTSPDPEKTKLSEGGGGEEGREYTPEEILSELEKEVNQGMSRGSQQGQQIADISKKSLDDDPDNYAADTSRDLWILPDESNTSFQESKNSVTSKVSQMSRYLEQALMAMAKSKKLSNIDKGKLDLRKLHRVPKSQSKNVFYKIKKGRTIDTAISVVIDESGSMSHRCTDARALAIAFGESLDKLRIPFEVIGFSTMGWGGSLPDGITRNNPIMAKVYKSFDERYMAVRTRLGAISSHMHNVDGENLELASYRLRRRRETRKIILSLSDGLPEAGHNNDKLMGRNLKYVCKKLRQKGIEIYGFGIQTESPREYYGAENFIYMPYLAEMGSVFYRELVNILGQGVVHKVQ